MQTCADELEKTNVSPAGNSQQNPAESTNAGKDISEQTATEETLENILNELIVRNDNFAAALAEKDKQLALQNVRIEYLAAQNLRYKQLVDRINSKWYGRLMMGVYHFFRKIGIIKAL